MTTPAEHAASGASEGRLRQGGRALLLALYTALRSLKLYPVENATVQKALDDLDIAARALVALEADLEIRLAGDFIFVNSTRLRLELDNYASFSQILAMLRAFSVGALRVHASANRREWQIFLSLLLSLFDRGDPDGRYEELFERLASAGVQGLEVERAVVQEHDPDAEQAKEQAKRIYSQGVAVTKDVITGARLGRATSVKRVKRAVQLIVDQVLNNETSLVGLTTIRDYDEYTFTHSVNVCIFSVALGKKLGFTRLQLYDLGMTALLHDVGKARVPVDHPQQDHRARRAGMADHAGPSVAGSAHPVRHALARRAAVPHDPRGARAPHEDRPDRVPQVRPRPLARHLLAHRGSGRRLRRRDHAAELPDDTDRAGPGAARDVAESEARLRRVLVKALINLIGIYPGGHLRHPRHVRGRPRGRAQSRRAAAQPSHWCASPWTRTAARFRRPGTLVSLTEQDESGAFRRSIVKVTNPERYGLTVGDYFV